VSNASVEFDTETLRPTYRLHVGLPGASNAFAIASRLGLDAGVLRRAESHLSELHRSLERTLREAERQRTELAGALDSARIAAEHARDKAAKRNLVDEAREALASAQRSREASAAPTATPATTIPVAAGSPVLVEGVSEPGTLIAVDDKGMADVAAGALRLRVPVSSLRAAPATVEPVRSARTTVSGSAPSVPLELDLRGARAEEALAVLDRYLNDAAVAGIDRLRIVHGKGTGALRAAVREMLSSHPLVREVTTAAQSEGGEGATIVRL